MPDHHTETGVAAVEHLPMMPPLRTCRSRGPLLLLPALVGLAMGLTACSTVEETASYLLTSNTQATALIAGRVLQGQARFTDARQGTLHLQTDDAPGLACFGPIRFTATGSGVASLSCSNGESVAIPFQSLSPLRGAGREQAGDRVLALTYGLAPDLAATYLGVPVERLTRTPP